MSTSHAISSDGTRIGFTCFGDATRPSILLIHGWAQQWMCWQPLWERLQDHYFVVAMDLRGHGSSDKPENEAAYTGTALWADDVQAVMDAAKLDMPVLVGWSYGARVIAAYLDVKGDADIAGVVLAGGVLAIGAHRESWMAGPASPGLDRDLYTDDVPRRLAATARFVDACTAAPLDRRTYAEMVGANMLCPAHVRRALFRADVDLRPVFGQMNCPALVIHGTQDEVVTPATGEAAAHSMRNGQYVPYEGIGHAPFLEAPDRFATDLSAFTKACKRTPV
ncbi:pimeloyl-ACP methyl ester carboxylesterase [Loktanella sp. PT4BL]|jgi:pimeloyl-ACP methyl ester carboxylesterase|uniref:alpha/beta fold hydrolase n=1 Tax=Loktanella sp. PT4BL TaxID=2135611 RepID=UPI000D754B0B|nr:alpha/beta hydrolase [Loktanella sp. PT4BL]PXW69241.1 pimeloyl-ACP methyl ester carboxylesterase [Loktanella sp. PT4BL]